MAASLSDSAVLYLIACHVFLPPQLPQRASIDSHERQVSLELIASVVRAARQYERSVAGPEERPQWVHMTRLFQRLYRNIEVPLEKGRLCATLQNMSTDDVLALYLKAQNAAVIIRKLPDSTIFEAFEVQAPAPNASVMSTPGKLVRQYPGAAVEVPNSTADDEDFLMEISNFLAQMETEQFKEATPTSRKAGSDVYEDRDSINPNYFIQLFFGFLRGMGEAVSPRQVVKRIADEVVWKGAARPWRRSPIWLIIRVALQTSLDSTLSYKHFMAFYHAQLLSLCQKHADFSSELLFTMRVKMARRLYKIKDSAPTPLVEASSSAAVAVKDVLQERWDQINAVQAQSPEWDPSAFDLDESTIQTLDNSRDYLERVFQGRSSQRTQSTFNPNHAPRLENIDEFARYANGSLAKTFSADKPIALFDFEASVYEHIASWTNAKKWDASNAGKIIQSCFQQYLTAASSYYKVDIADQSIMILTLMRLWMAIDQLAITEFPLLLDFSPEIPQDLIEPLLLRTSLHIEQARIIQQHLRSRYARALPSAPSIYSDGASIQSFPVRYFRQSPRLQLLKSTIETDAQIKRNDKIRELNRENEEYARLSRSVEQASHYHPAGQTKKSRRKNCERCRAERALNQRKVKIKVHEWPLPSRQLEAELVVFELERPALFTIWRDTTYAILSDLGSMKRNKNPNLQLKLESYDDLRPWLSSPAGISSRIGLASTTKPFIKGHYSTTKIPATQGQVCVNNGLSFKVYDNQSNKWAAAPFTDVAVTKFGTLELPSNSPYQHLRYSLEGTYHFPNQVLADQYDCPKDLSLHEHIAYGTLRSGPRLQWMNIVRGLEENILTFSSEEVMLLHAQAAWQIGPLCDDGVREWHQELNDPEFGELLISSSRRLLERVEANWLQANALSTVVLLVSRLLASSPDSHIVRDAFQFLREARQIALNWLEQLQGKLQSAEIEADVLSCQSRICEMAAICRSTFDVDLHHITSLFDKPEDFSAFIKCFIIQFDSQPTDPAKATTILQTRLSRDRRLSHRALAIVRRISCLNDRILCTPISEVWPQYQAGESGWRELTAPNSRWVSTVTAERNRSTSQRVHLDLLEGKFLVDGKPIGRLPREYIQHPTYLRLFGQKVIDAVPAGSTSMEFVTRRAVYGYEVSFALVGSRNELVIQAHKDNRTFELVPHSQFMNDFPEFFSSDYHHWADLETRMIEFRPLEYPWSSDHRQWLLRFNQIGQARLEDSRSGSTRLINMHSSLSRAISRRVEPLESSRYLHITQSPDHQVQIELPCMKLSFFINKDMQIESQNFRAQIIDDNQFTGTMSGLRNQLVLCARDPVSRSLPRSRSVIIPYGDVRFSGKEYHVSVTIERPSGRHVVFHRYLIDKNLGSLVTDTGLTSRLYKIYLHALTSHCLVDPLTGRTGTEEALHELCEPACSSFEQIDAEQARLLQLIGLLTPKQEYYPSHLKCMLLTNWEKLPFLSQHFAFSTATSHILHRAKNLELFNPLDFDPSDYIHEFDSCLLKRAARRSHIYYAPTDLDCIVQLIKAPDLQDQRLTVRDCLTAHWKDAGQAAAWASGLVFRSWGRPPYKPYNFVSLVESWKTLRVEGTSGDLDLTYSPLWLNLEPSSSWIDIYELCRRAKSSSNKYAFSACLASAAFSQRLPLDLLVVIVAVATNPSFQLLPSPPYSHFELNDGYHPTHERIKQLVLKTARKLQDSPANAMRKQDRESSRELKNRRQAFYDQEIQKHKADIVEDLVGQWPSSRLQLHSLCCSPWFVVKSFLADVQAYFSSCLRNIELRIYLRAIEANLSSQPASSGTKFQAMHIPPSQHLVMPELRQFWEILDLRSLICSRPRPGTGPAISFPKIPISAEIGRRVDTSRLSHLFNEFKRDAEPLYRRYGDELEESRAELARQQVVITPRTLPSVQVFFEHAQECRAGLQRYFQSLQSALFPLTAIESIVFESGIWPRITPRTILQQLSLKSRLRIQHLPEWLDKLIGYAQAFATYQQSQRLIALAAHGNSEELYQELKSDGGVGIRDPDWLLVQIDGNFNARSLQCQVAEEMVEPSSGVNTVLQLNMGEGKSSVIVPLVATSLANTEQLVRVVVLKPLWRQMFHLLVNRLSGLAHRRIYYFPFARHIRLDSSKAQQLKSLFDECMREGGIVLTQPEHILSFKLMGINQLISASTAKEESAAHQLQNMQGWLTVNTRDILDESDEILHVRYQLVYTVGEQQPFEDHPDRWITTQHLLQIAAVRISHLERHHSGSLQHEAKSHGQFPSIRIMPDCENTVEQLLLHEIAQDVLAGHILTLNCRRLAPSVRQVALSFMTEKNFPYSNYQKLKGSCDPVIWKGLLLVRGLLASGILVFGLKAKHYRVDYGLDLSRSLLAVPYRAKDTPSLRAEFGHPDVTIVLTCLSYYYKGLTDDQLAHCFELLFKLDNPPHEYERWVTRNKCTPTDLKELIGVNIKDGEQFRNRIIPAFSRNSAVVDFFLSYVIFPKAAKQFPHKLSTSGWDLAERKPRVTTGFSGTNDNRYLLPTSITQDDPVNQLSTNALVLTYLLQPENNHYVCACDQDGRKLNSMTFLRLLVEQEPEIRVLLDVGAQILDLQNEELVRHWMKLRPDVEAAIYFNDMDEIVVLPQDGIPSPLHSSPYIQQLDKCIVYLDDGHTRGTDLKLPRHTRALVTLGPKVTKDRLLQGCMRMRKLGHGQSVLFAAPPEIDRQIRAAAPSPLNPGDKVDALDVIRWAMQETCKDLRHHASHWAQQGIEYKRRTEAQLRYQAGQGLATLESGWTTVESHSLEDMYGSRLSTSLARSSLTRRAFNDSDLQERLMMLGIERLDDGNIGEEQEREVNHEIEREHQVERPPKEQPAVHSVHYDVQLFIRTGTIPPRSTGITSLFYPLQSFGTEALTTWSRNLYASIDFMRTLRTHWSGSLSDYMRPVNWVVQAPNGVLVVLSPYEVNELLPSLRQSPMLRLHVYAPRVSQSMLSFSNLDFYTLPRPAQLEQPFPTVPVPLFTQVQLDLFAGQLYFSDYQAYTSLCAVLGLYFYPADGDQWPEIEIEGDGFIQPRYRKRLIRYHLGYATSKFTSSPIPMLKDLIGRRRKGMAYSRTHLGKMFYAQNLTPDEF